VATDNPTIIAKIEAGAGGPGVYCSFQGADGNTTLSTPSGGTYKVVGHPQAQVRAGCIQFDE
jgi:hypothetical protein